MVHSTIVAAHVYTRELWRARTRERISSKEEKRITASHAGVGS